MPKVYMIAGPNGAGKTTIAMELLPGLLNCYEYINADSIAAGLSPFKVDEMAFRAGRLMLERIHDLAKQNQDFAFETTGASKSFVPFLEKCKIQHYQVNLCYIWLNSKELAKRRIADRVSVGGHNIPEEIIVRRYERSLKNFLQNYIYLADEWMIYDNSGFWPELVAHRQDGKIVITNEQIYKTIIEWRVQDGSC